MADFQMEVFDEVFGSQFVFRNLLDAMARPGTVKDIGKTAKDLKGAAGFSKTAAAIALTLLDEYTAFAFRGEKSEEVKRYLKLNTGAAATDIADADYIFINSDLSEAEIDDLLTRAKRGSLIKPDDSATLIIDVTGIKQGHENEGLTFILQGPGIEDENICSLKGLSSYWLIRRIESVAEFPLGVDLIFAAEDGRIMALPRTTLIRPAEEWFSWAM